MSDDLQRQGIGTKMFNNMVKELGKKNIKQVRGLWRPDSTNFKMYKEAVEQGLENPAFKTFTGRMAEKLGFTKAKDLTVDNDNLKYFLFSK